MGVVEVSNEYEAEAMIFLGIPGIHSYGQVPGFYLVQRNGKDGKFTLEAINFYNSTFNEG